MPRAQAVRIADGELEIRALHLATLVEDARRQSMEAERLWWKNLVLEAHAAGVRDGWDR